MAKKKVSHCPYCGERIHPDAKRCPHCGEKIKKFSFLKFIRDLIIFIVVTAIILIALLFAYLEYNTNKHEKEYEERRAHKQTEAVANTTTPTPTQDYISYEIEEIQEVGEVTERSGISPDFKVAMDSYEAFYDEYCETMTKVAEGDATALLNYASMLSKAAEMDETFNNYNEDDMTVEEMQYYIEVNARVQQKLLSVASE